jgi:serum/glucocorticoid-regulated kinase 2
MIINYCPGGDLANALYNHNQKRFSEEVSKMYICEIILAIEYLHQNKILYRNLKPENVFFDEDGHVILIDFCFSE